MTCGVCGKFSATPGGLRVHGSIMHRGIPHEVWEPGWEPKKRGPSNPPLTVSDFAIAKATGDARIRARGQANYASILRDKPSAADALAKLPWTTYPKNVADAEAVATYLGDLMDSAPSAVRGYLANQRAYLLALADLLRAKAA